MPSLVSTPTPLERINAFAVKLARLRVGLADISATIEAEQRDVMRKHRAKLRDIFNRTAAAQSELRAEVAAHPKLFEKPRTFTIDGVKFGYAKGKGKTDIADEEKTIALIRKHLGKDVAEALIKTEESVIKNAAANLTPADLKRVGIQISDVGDEVVISYTDSALDKLLTRLLEEAGKDEA